MEVTHTDLSEVTRMVLIEVDAMVVLTTGITTTTRMLAMLANTPMTGRDVTTLLTVFMQTSRLRTGTWLDDVEARVVPSKAARLNRSSVETLKANSSNLPFCVQF